MNNNPIVSEFYNYDIELSENFSMSVVNHYSKINFDRYKKFLISYLNTDRKLSFSLDNENLINIKIFTKESPAILSLTFNKNGFVDFLALERGNGQNEAKPFFLKGVIETSNNKKYAYKIKRLLAFLDAIDDENSIVHSMNINFQYMKRIDFLQKKSQYFIDIPSDSIRILETTPKKIVKRYI